MVKELYTRYKSAEKAHTEREILNKNEVRNRILKRITGWSILWIIPSIILFYCGYGFEQFGYTVGIIGALALAVGTLRKEINEFYKHSHAKGSAIMKESFQINAKMLSTQISDTVAGILLVGLSFILQLFSSL